MMKANSADPDQTGPKERLGSTLFAILSAPLGLIVSPQFQASYAFC